MARADCNGHIDGSPLRIVLIGVGARGRRHLAVAQACQAVEVVGVSDVDGIAHEELPAHYPVYRDTGELLDAVEPAAAIISVPHSAYFGAMTECCARGVVILKEKPLARSVREARELVTTVSQSSAAMVVASQRRQSSVFAALEMALRESSGSPYAVHYEYALGRADLSTRWRQTRDLAGGGAALDMGYHVFDLLTTLFGVPIHVAALPGNIGREGSNSVEHLVAALLSFPGGTLATVIIGIRLWPEREHLLVWSEREQLAVVDGELWRDDPNGPQLIAGRESSDELIHRQLHEFVRFVTLGLSGSCSTQEAMRTTETVAMVQRAMSEVVTADETWHWGATA